MMKNKKEDRSAEELIEKAKAEVKVVKENITFVGKKPEPTKEPQKFGSKTYKPCHDYEISFYATSEDRDSVAAYMDTIGVPYEIKSI